MYEGDWIIIPCPSFISLLGKFVHTVLHGQPVRPVQTWTLIRNMREMKNVYCWTIEIGKEHGHYWAAVCWGIPYNMSNNGYHWAVILSGQIVLNSVKFLKSVPDQPTIWLDVKVN